MAWLTGYPREKVEWHPTVDRKKCVKCGMCLNCGNKVYDWTSEGAKVARPNACVVGCTTCGNLCLGKAISFPSLDGIRSLYKNEDIWDKVKKQLEAEGTLVINDK